VSKPDLIANPNPVLFTPDNVRAAVPPGTAGAYVLYAQGEEESLAPEYVGRSDTDLQRRLLRHPHADLDYFAIQVCKSPLEAYRLERRLYWWLIPPRNTAFPAYPDDERLRLNKRALRAAVEWPVLRIDAPA